MKVVFKFLMMIALGLFIISCSKEKKQEVQQKALKYSVDASHSSLQWTAYKTTEKIPVKGTFTDIKIKNSQKGKDVLGALHEMEFEIPVSSIYSKDTIRDAKLNLFFFDIMAQTVSLKGKFKEASNNKGTLELTMNGFTKQLPFNYEISRDTILMEAVMDLNVWEAGPALESLNKACEELHTGPDGVSKTWDEVKINAKILTKEN